MSYRGLDNGCVTKDQNVKINSNNQNDKHHSWLKNIVCIIVTNRSK